MDHKRVVMQHHLRGIAILGLPSIVVQVDPKCATEWAYFTVSIEQLRGSYPQTWTEGSRTHIFCGALSLPEHHNTLACADRLARTLQSRHRASSPQLARLDADNVTRMPAEALEAILQGCVVHSVEKRTWR